MIALARAIFCFMLLSVVTYNASASEIIEFPSHIDKKCRAGNAKLYDECSDQLEIFDEALRTAKKTGKTLLVSYGAEWCIWCHVFDAYIKGGKTKFTYVYASREAPDEKYQSTIYEREKNDVTKQAISLFRFVI